MLKSFKKNCSEYFIILLLANFAYFAHDYFAHYPTNSPENGNMAINSQLLMYSRCKIIMIIFKLLTELGRPYIYYLFYTKTNPVDYRKTAVIHRDAFGFVTVESFGKYLFPDNYNYNLSKTKKVLYINTPYSLPKNIKILKNILSVKRTTGVGCLYNMKQKYHLDNY